MASRIITDCDLHAQAGEQVEGETIPPFMLYNDRMVTVDLCVGCQNIITYTSLQDLGALVGVDQAPRRMSQGATKPHESLEDRTCRWCERTFNSQQGRKKHEATVHREERVALGELEPTADSSDGDPDLQWVDPAEAEPVGKIVHDETGDHEEPLDQPDTSHVGEADFPDDMTSDEEEPKTRKRVAKKTASA